jgi:hypothetical protein
MYKLKILSNVVIQIKLYPVILGGVMVIMLATGTKVCGFKPSPEQWIFKGDKNPQHDFLWRGCKAVSPMS